MIYGLFVCSVSGPFCGSSAEFLAQEVTSLTGSMLVVFYSDTRGERRSGGIFRALAAQSSMQYDSTFLAVFEGLISNVSFPQLNHTPNRSKNELLPYIRETIKMFVT